VRIWVDEHALFRKEGFNLVTELPVRLTTALTGGTIEIDTLDGPIELKIPQGTSHGEILRVKGKGVPYETAGVMGNRSRRGDLLIVTHVLMPKKLSKEAQRLIDELKQEGI
jgi:molecular chaperone DnaJ